MVISTDMPSNLVSLVLDKATSDLGLDQEPLRKFLKNVVAAAREFTTRACAELAHQLAADISECKKNLHQGVAEKVGELQERMSADPRFSGLEVKLEGFKADFRQLEPRFEAADRRLQDVHEEIKSEMGELSTKLQAVIERQAKRSSISNARSSAVLDEDAVAKKRDSVKKEEAGTRVTSEELQEVQKFLAQVGEQTEAVSNQIVLLEEKMHDELGQLHRRNESSDAFLQEQIQRIDNQGERLYQVEGAIDHCASQLTATGVFLQRLAADKAEDASLQELRQKVDEVELLAARSAEAADMAPRVLDLEIAKRNFVKHISEAKVRMEATEKGVLKLNSDLIERGDRYEDDLRRATTASEESCAKIATRGATVAARVSAAETRLDSFAKTLKSLASKADASEVVSLRSAVGNIAEEMKDGKEQAVLFGARCLSCNRVFDDVDRHAGVVSNPVEKQRAQVLAEIQRALHSPRCDPLDSINLLAVKVGRTADIRSKSSQYAGRDAGGFARGVADVTLVPVRPGAAGTPRPGTTGRVALPSAGASRPATTDGAATSGGRSFAVSPKTGTLDYKQPVYELVGRD